MKQKLTMDMRVKVATAALAAMRRRVDIGEQLRNLMKELVDTVLHPEAVGHHEVPLGAVVVIEGVVEVALGERQEVVHQGDEVAVMVVQ